MKLEYKNLVEFKREVENNVELQNRIKEDPVAVIKQVQQAPPKPLDSDKWIYRIVVLALGITIVSIIIGVLILIGKGEINDDKAVPTILTAIGSAAIGALAGLLAPNPKGSGDSE